MGVTSTKASKLGASLRRQEAVRWLSGVQWKLASMRGVRSLPPVSGEEDLPPVPRTSMRVYAKG